MIPEDVAGLYVVGGASEFPLVSRVLRRRFGRRVHRSTHNAGSTAIGLAIAADEQAGYTVSERLARGLGVFREYDSGASLSFDPLLTPMIDGHRAKTPLLFGVTWLPTTLATTALLSIAAWTSRAFRVVR